MLKTMTFEAQYGDAPDSIHGRLDALKSAGLYLPKPWLKEGRIGELKIPRQSLLLDNSTSKRRMTLIHAKIKPDLTMVVRVGICAAFFENVGFISDVVRERGYRSFLRDSQAGRYRGLPKFMTKHLNSTGDALLEPTDHPWCADSVAAVEMWEHYAKCDLGPWLLSPAQIGVTLRSFLDALSSRWVQWDFSSIKIRSATIYYNWGVEGLENFVPGIRRDFPAQDSRPIKKGRNWVEALDGKKQPIRGAFAMAEDATASKPHLLRLQFRLPHDRIETLGILSMDELLRGNPERAIRLEPLVRELRDRIAGIHLHPCINEVELVNSGKIDALRSLLLFLHPEWHDAYWAHRATRVKPETLKREMRRVRDFLVQLLTAQQPTVPDAHWLERRFAGFGLWEAVTRSVIDGLSPRNLNTPDSRMSSSRVH